MLLYGALSLGFLVLAAGLAVPIESERRELQLNWSPARAEGLPPDIAITSAALGTFRGLAVNFLWLRAVRLHEEGRFHEAMQLSDWITTLQPRFPRVWEFHAWNMAYNLSSASHDPEQRWVWVNAGIRLLRDRGIQHNPHSLGLYRELAWLYFHKIGRYHDSANLFYKTRLAEHWQEILGAPPDGSPEAYGAWLEGRLGVDSVAERVRNEEGMDPEFMLTLARAYGPLDWRHSSSHALYWVQLGRRRSEESVRGPELFVSREADRLVFHALRALTHEGRITFEPESGYFSTSPDSRFVASFEKALEEVVDRGGGRDSETYRAGHRGFLEWALRVAVSYGDRAEADRLLKRLRELYGDPARSGHPYDVGAEEFVQAALDAGLDDPVEVKQVVAGLLFRALEEGVAVDKPERAAELVATAREVYVRFGKEEVDPDTSLEQLGLRPFEEMVGDAARQFFSDGGIPVPHRARAWSNLPPAARLQLWPRLKTSLESAARGAGLDASVTFPPPSADGATQ